jgi:hypothetical protein
MSRPEKPKSRKAPPAKAAELDPVFAAIAEHKALNKEWHRLDTKLDEAKFQAQETHGAMPLELIAWRNYEAIGGYEIDKAREEFLKQPGADHEQVEKEYQDAKAREAAAECARNEWDLRVGVAPLREQFWRIDWEERRAAARLARTKPDSVPGAAALLAYLTQRNRVYDGFEGWEFRAIKTVAVALVRMEESA